MAVIASRTAHARPIDNENAFSRALRENGLLIVLTALFLVSIVGQIFTGNAEYNQSQEEHAQAAVSVGEYLLTGHLLETLAENWESEFLQMAAYVLLTVFLRQKGSAESKKLDEPEAVDEDPRSAGSKQDAPWPVRKGGLILTLYENSLVLTFVALFALSFALHAVGGANDYNEEAAAHGQTEQVSAAQYVATSRFWFESFQNWQSEFLSLAAMVGFSIFLRQRGSPESKPVAASHSHTGAD
jgi:hypothetical protein